MKVNTDKDVFGFVKGLLRDCQLSNLLDIYFICPDQNADNYYRFDINNVEDLPGKMFDLSLSKRVSDIYSFGYDNDNGRVSTIEVHLSDSPDHQTNITPRMIDFFRTIVNPFSRDVLASALKPPKPKPMDDYLNWGGRFMTAPIVESNPWDYFEQDDSHVCF